MEMHAFNTENFFVDQNYFFTNKIVPDILFQIQEILLSWYIKRILNTSRLAVII